MGWPWGTPASGMPTACAGKGCAMLIMVADFESPPKDFFDDISDEYRYPGKRAETRLSYWYALIPWSVLVDRSFPHR